MYKEMSKYAAKHLYWYMTVHIMFGMGIGILVARPYIFHPLRWGWGLIIASAVIYFWPWVMKKK